MNNHGKGWITHCKIAFVTEARSRHYRLKNKRIDLVIHEMSVESNINPTILKRWWYEHRFKVELPLCEICHKNAVELNSKTNKPKTQKSKWFGYCRNCRDLKYMRSR